jgi:hypothetical protein
MRWFTLLVVFSAALLAGCDHTIGGLLASKSKKEKELTAMRLDYEQKIAAKEAEVTTAKDGLIAGKDNQMRAAAGAFYGQGVVFDSILTPSRTDWIFNNLAEEGWTALGHIQPTYEAMQAMNERLKAELDETRTSLADLQHNHQAAVAENQQLADQTKRWQDKLAAAEREKTELNQRFSADLSRKQAELLDVQNQLIATEKARSDEKKARQAQLAKLSWGAGILAALCLAGAIFSPVMKRELSILAAIMGGAAVAIPFVETWMILSAVGLAAAGLVGWILLKHRKEERVADSLTLGLQRLKDHSAETWQQVAPYIEDSLKRYVKKDGKLVAEKDPAIETHIDAKLAEYEALGPVPTTQPTKT